MSGGNAMASVEDKELDPLICSVDMLLHIIRHEHRFVITSIDQITWLSFLIDG